MEKKGAGGITAGTIVEIEIVKMFLIWILEEYFNIFSQKFFWVFFFKALHLKCFKGTGNK